VELLVVAEPVAAKPGGEFAEDHSEIAQATGFGHWHVPTIGAARQPCQHARHAASLEDRWTSAKLGSMVVA
jgi:hypothetical protein